jgi:hypothetical protein
VAETYYRWGTSRRQAGDKRMDLLWPVEVWTVQVPQPGTHINVFQEAILGLLLSGVRELSDLSEQLALDKQLVAFIIAQELQPRAWVDQRQAVTDKGREALQGMTDPDRSLVVKYAFRDGLGGQWLPRLSDELPEEFSVPGSTPDRPVFDRDRNSGHTLKPYFLKGKPQPLPDVMALRKAVREFQRDLRSTDDQTALTWDDLDGSQIELLSDTPQTAHVWCQIYTATQDIQPWLVSDPWGVSAALKPLRLALEKQLEHEPVLEMRMQERLALGGKSISESDRDWEAQTVFQAEAQVQQWLGALNTPQLQPIRERVLGVLRLETVIKDSIQPRQEQLDSLATQSGKMLEALMQWVLIRWVVDARAWPRNNDDPKRVEKLLAELSLPHQLNPKWKEALRRQNWHSVRNAAVRQDQPFKALLCAALLATQYHPDHPLRMIELTNFDFNQFKLRNDGSHHTGKKMQRDEILAFSEMCLDWLGQFRPYFSI